MIYESAQIGLTSAESAAACRTSAICGLFLTQVSHLPAFDSVALVRVRGVRFKKRVGILLEAAKLRKEDGEIDPPSPYIWALVDTAQVYKNCEIAELASLLGNITRMLALDIEVDGMGSGERLSLCRSRWGQRRGCGVAEERPSIQLTNDWSFPIQPAG